VGFFAAAASLAGDNFLAGLSLWALGGRLGFSFGLALRAVLGSLIYFYCLISTLALITRITLPVPYVTERSAFTLAVCPVSLML
jgi:hypothetical protein